MCDAQTWISIADAAILLKVKPATVLRRIEKGTLPARRSVDMPFTYDGKENYEVRLDALPQRLQYQYLYSHLPESDICSLDLISPRSVLGNVWLDVFLDISSLIRDAAVIRQQHRGTGHITDELRKLADRHGISLATLYRLTGKPSSEGISALYTDPFYLRDRLPATMCLWNCDLAFALYLDSDNQYSQNDIMTEFDKLRSSIPCADCPYHPGKSDGTDIPKCPAPHEHMPVPNHRKTINRLLRHIPPQMILYARKGYREWRAQYGLFVMRDRPLLVNESWQGDHHKFDLFVRITIQTEHNGKAYEKEIAVRPTLTGWIDSATSAFVGWVISVTPNSDTIAEAFCRAAVLKPGSPIRGLPKTAIVDCGKDYKSKLLEDVPAELAPWTSDDTELNKRFAGLGLLPALGVEVAHALPYHPQSKFIERCFGILEEKWISKLPGWCRNSIHERPEDFQKTLTALLSDRKLLTLEEFVQHFQNIILPEYHSTVDSETTVPELSGWQLSVSSMAPLQRYAGNYIEMVCREENVQFSYPAQQALIATALNSGIGGINAFTTIIGRCITLARVHYYNLPGHSIPDKAKCVRTEVPGGAAYPGAKLILTLPVTSDPVHISEQMVSDMQSEYKSHFPKMVSSKQRKAPTGSASQEGALSGNTGTQA